MDVTHSLKRRKGGRMKSSYYEMIYYPEGLNLRSFPCNVMVNRSHWHSSLEIIICFKGTLSVRVGSEEYCMSEGDLVTIDSGIPHEMFGGQPGGQQLIFNLDEKMIRRDDGFRFDFRTVGKNSLEKSHLDAKKVIRAVYILACGLHNIYGKYSAIRELPGKQYYHMMSTAYGILETLQDYAIPVDKESIHVPSDLLLRCIEMMQNEYCRIRTAEDAAERLRISVSTLHRLLRTQLGVSFLPYLNSIRISSAEALLLNPQYNIIDIPELCGFTSLSNFYRVFKESAGCSPKHYRQHNASVKPQYLNPSVLQWNSFEGVTIDQLDPNFFI